jgi:hypothetical protein
MQLNNNYSPQIFQPKFLARAHTALSPRQAQAAAASAGWHALAAGRSTWAGCYHDARQEAHGSLGRGYAAVDTVFGNASPKGRGVVGHLSHGLSALGAAVVSAPTWLCRNVDVSVYVYKRIKELFLVPCALPCMASAMVGLALKAALTAIGYPALLAVNLLLNAWDQPPARPPRGPEPEAIALRPLSPKPGRA